MAAWGLIALLIAVFPANVHMAMHPDSYPMIAPTALLIRLPLQGVLVAWAYSVHAAVWLSPLLRSWASGTSRRS